MNYKLVALMVVCCIAVIAAAGCLSSPQKVLEQASGSGSSDASYVYTGTAEKGVLAPRMAGTPAPIPAGAPVAGSSGSIETKIIRTAYLTIEVKDVTASVDTLKNLVASRGGYLSSSSISQGYNNRLTGTVVLRIPAAEFDTTLDGVKAVGKVKSVSTQGEDVTEEYVDLQAQKTSYLNQLARYNEIMKRAVNVSDVIEIQQQIDRVQTELNRLEGRLKFLDNRIDMSTITVNLQEPEPVGGESGYSIVSTINEGIGGFFGMISFLIVLFFTVLPVIILGAVAYGIYRWRKGKEPVKVMTEPEKK